MCVFRDRPWRLLRANEINLYDFLPKILKDVDKHLLSNMHLRLKREENLDV